MTSGRGGQVLPTCLTTTVFRSDFFNRSVVAVDTSKMEKFAYECLLAGIIVYPGYGCSINSFQLTEFHKYTEHCSASDDHWFGDFFESH